MTTYRFRKSADRALGRRSRVPGPPMTLSTRLVTAMVALVVLSAAIIGVFTYRNIETVVIPRSLEWIESRARLLALELEASVRGPHADVVGFRSAVAVEGIVRASLSGGRPERHQPRAMARSARRALRRRACRQAELFAVSHHRRRRRRPRDHTRRSQRAGQARSASCRTASCSSAATATISSARSGSGPNEVDVSPIELNQEQGVVEPPHVPVIRTAAAIHTPDGRPFGIVVINVDLRRRVRPHPRRGAGRTADLSSSTSAATICFIRIRAASSASPSAKPQRLRRRFSRSRRVLATVAAPPRASCATAAATAFGVALAPVRLAPGPRGGGRRSHAVCADHRACDRGAQLDPARRSRRRPARGHPGGPAGALADAAAGRDDARGRGLRRGASG